MSKYSGLPPDLKKSIAKHGRQADPTDLRGELAVARALLESAQGNPATSVALLQTITRLVREYELGQIRKREMIHRDQVTRIAQQIVHILSDRISHIEGWESIVDGAVLEITQAIDTTE